MRVNNQEMPDIWRRLDQNIRTKNSQGKKKQEMHRTENININILI